jgi:acetoin utilization deacetylase AcuC-like enzyme
VLEEFAPQLLLVSAGFDAHERDPLASMRMTTDGYAAVIAQLKDVAARHGGLALVTEGGYDLTALAACLEAAFAVLSVPPAGDAAADPAIKRPYTRPAPISARAERALASVREVQAAYWRGI